MKNLPLLFALWLLAVLACGGSSTSPRQSATPLPAPIPVTAVALVSAYEANEVAADDAYRGKPLIVTGTVDSVDTILGTTSVTLRGSESSFVGVQCFFDDSERGAVARIRKGSAVTLKGTCDGKGLNVELKDCTVQ